jgi:hypothetical protein
MGFGFGGGTGFGGGGGRLPRAGGRSSQFTKRQKQRSVFASKPPRVPLAAGSCRGRARVR